MANGNLHAAKSAKNDEFYTQLSDIEKELCHYRDFFKGKVVFCNCDDPKSSNFWKYFQKNFLFLGLKKLISTHYEPGRQSYKMEIITTDLSAGQRTIPDYVKTPLKGDGDFRSKECVEILKEADVVVSNPPFSKFREYVAQLMKHEKKFIIIGSKNAITYKEFFLLLKNNKVWTGHYSVKEFLQPDGTKKKFGNIGWYTNVDIPIRHAPIPLSIKYYGNEEHYPQYDNYDAINVDKVSEIPADYHGVMGVPISFIDKYCPEQFEIVGMDLNCLVEELGIRCMGQKWVDTYFSQGGTGHYTANMHTLSYIHNGVAYSKYRRVLIKRK